MGGGGGGSVNKQLYFPDFEYQLPKFGAFPKSKISLCLFLSLFLLLGITRLHFGEKSSGEKV